MGADGLAGPHETEWAALRPLSQLQGRDRDDCSVHPVFFDGREECVDSPARFGQLRFGFNPLFLV
jgi:hypothetical protein